jgi:predicted membrane protein (TIGR00267 family)
VRTADRELGLLVALSRSRAIARRYFVTNGFDGALAMLGLTMGFHVAGNVPVHTVFNACVGTAIALMMSGLSSAYVSEAAERRRELQELEAAMVTDLGGSAHARAARYTPWLIALVNGLAPLAMSMVIIAPLWLSVMGLPWPLPLLESAIGLAFAVIFLLGVFLGRISGVFWLWSALRTLAIAALTALLVLQLPN